MSPSLYSGDAEDFKWHCINDQRLNAQNQTEAASVTVCSVLLLCGLQFPFMKSNL